MRGGIFQPAFLRGIKCLRLDALMDVRFIRLVFDMCAHPHLDATRLVSRVPAGLLTMNYWQAQMIFSPNLRTRQQSHPYRTLHSSCRSSGTPSDKRTRELQNTLRRTSELIRWAVSVAFVSLTRQNVHGELTTASSREISPNNTCKRLWNTSRLRRATHRMMRITLVSRERLHEKNC